MPHTALSRAAATVVTLVALVGATLAAPTALAADAGDRKAPAASSSKKAAQTLGRAQTALAGKGGDATLALRDLWLQRGNLSAADRATYSRLAARPIKTSFVDAGNVRVWYTPAELTGGYDQNVVASNAALVAQTYSAAGYRLPKPDFGKGGSDQTDIYVDSLPQGLYGYCTVDDDVQQPGPGRYDVPAFCVVDNDYAGFPTNTPVENLQVTLAHEYFHATQFAYDVADDGYAMEATAAWVEDEVYDNIDDNVQYLSDSPITDRKRSIDKFGGFFHYGVWIYFRYLSEKFPGETGTLPTIVRDLWEAADSSKGAKKDKYFTQGMAQVLKKKPYKTSLDKEFALFSDANVRAPSFYDEGTSNTANAYPAAKINGNKALNKGQSKAFNAKLDHLSAASYAFTPKGNAKKINVAISGAPKAQGTRAVVSTYLDSGKVKTKYVSINSKGKGAYSGTFKKSKVTAVVVTLVNASVRFIDCYKKATPFSCSGKPLDQKRKISVFGKAV
jgi:hypothetical protein